MPVIWFGVEADFKRQTFGIDPFHVNRTLYQMLLLFPDVRYLHNCGRKKCSQVFQDEKGSSASTSGGRR